MKKRMAMLVILFLTAMILGTMQPTVLFGAEAPEDVWVLLLVDPEPYPPIKWVGPLSIYYDIRSTDCGGELGYAAMMYYTVRLNKDSDTGPTPTLYIFQGETDTCLNDWDGQATIIREFLGTVVVPVISPKTGKFWKVESVTKGKYNDDPVSRAFVGDIKIAVKK